MKIVVKRLDPERATPESRAALGEWGEELDERYRFPAGCLLLAADWSEPITIAGTAAFRRVSPEVCEVRRTVVKKAFQHQGLGHVLMMALTDQARAAGYVRMRVEAPASIPELPAFYQREGFAVVPAFRMATLDELESVVFLEKAL